MLESRPDLAPVNAIDDCWNRIGNHGDHSCARLTDHVLCRNCPVYAAAAKTLLDRLPAGQAHADSLTTSFATDVLHAHLAGEGAREQPDEVFIVFRVGREWLALPARALEEVGTLRRIHSLPHRRGGAILGVANVRGNLTVCLSPIVLLGLGGAQADGMDSVHAQAASQGRMLMVTTGASSVVLPVDQVDGARRIKSEAIRPLPSTVSGAASSLARGLIREGDRDIGVLDDGRLRDHIARSLR